MSSTIIYMWQNQKNYGKFILNVYVKLFYQFFYVKDETSCYKLGNLSLSNLNNEFSYSIHEKDKYILTEILSNITSISIKNINGDDNKNSENFNPNEKFIFIKSSSVDDYNYVIIISK